MRATLAVLLTVLLLTGCSTSNPPTGRDEPVVRAGSPSPSPEPPSHGPSSHEPPSAGPAGARVTFAAPARSGRQPVAITYDTKLVAVGAAAAVGTTSADDTTKVRLDVWKLAPNHRFGAHVHTRACGAKPADAGPHYQDRKDPVSPSVDPAYANPDNEVWLDFATDASGAGHATADLPWRFRAGAANSVVIHAHHTSTEPGKAGMAGDRLACITVPTL